MLKSLFWRINFFLKYKKSQRVKRKLGSDNSRITVDTKNGVFAVDVTDLEVGAKLRTKGEYGIDEIERLSSLINAKSSILVVGAHIGALCYTISKTMLKSSSNRSQPK
tara:strand:+ start:1389 stop:1712 length:324 start_codon:yes stop_codon:yes gene_type:complete